MSAHSLSCECGQSFSSVDLLQDHLDEHRPEELICVVDTSDPEGRDLVTGYDAEVVRGLVVVREVYDMETACEVCETVGAYCLKNSMMAVGLCREHLEEDPSFAGIVEDEGAMKDFKLPESPVLNGGDA